ncbi:hypothetical protein PYCC9005_001742 [Savitreella phatthalungensis]
MTTNIIGLRQTARLDEFFPPEVVYVGFTRISAISKEHEARLVAQEATSKDVLIAVCLLQDDHYKFTTSIGRQDSIQALARTLEANLVGRNITVACLVDLGSDNVLRWSDTVDDVLDQDSVVGLMPVNRAVAASLHMPTMVGAMSSARYNSAPIPQEEFPDPKPRSASVDYTGMRRPSQTLRARLKRKESVTSIASRVTPAMQVYNMAPIIPLPASTNESNDLVRRRSQLQDVKSNAFMLRDFCRFCARKRSLLELLFWLETAVEDHDPDYIDRLFIRPDAPLRLNLPTELTGISDARALVQDGQLLWSFGLFEQASEGAHTVLLQVEHPDLYQQAAMRLRGTAGRENFINLMTQALSPDDTTILSHRERKETRTRQSILERLCDQFFPNSQIDSRGYFELREEHMTLPERTRLDKRRAAFGQLDGSDGLSLQAVPRVFVQGRAAQPAIAAEFYDRTSDFLDDARAVDLNPATVATISQPANETNVPLEQTQDNTEYELDSDATSLMTDDSDKSRLLNLRSQRLLKAQKLSSLLGLQVDQNGHVTSTSAPHERRGLPRAISGGVDADELSASRRAEIVKRQHKLRSVFGSPSNMIPSPATVKDTENAGVRRSSVVGSSIKSRAKSPAASTRSRRSDLSDFSAVSRQTRDADVERRAQARKLAKLYAQFGDHTSRDNNHGDAHLGYSTNQRSLLRGRASINDLRRPETSMSNYAHSIGRSSIGGRSTKTGMAGRYLPDRGGPAHQHSLQQSRLLNFFNPSSQQATRRGSRSQQPQQASEHSEHQPRSPLMHDNASSSTLPLDPYAVGAVVHSTVVEPLLASPSINSFVEANQQPTRASFDSEDGQGEDFHDIEEEEEEEEEDEDDEGEAIVQDVKTRMKLRQMLGHDAPAV